MRIVCIAASFVPSNAANSIQVLKAAHALAELGHTVTLLVPGNETSPWAALRDHYGLSTPFRVEWLAENLTFRRYDYAFKAVQRAAQLEPALVYTWVLQAAVLSLGRGLPTLLELHDRVTGRLGPWLFRRFWRSRTPQRVLTNTEALRQVLLDNFNLASKANQILVGPNGVELDRYADLPLPAEARQELGLPEGFTAGYTGHFYAGRGMDLMFALAKSLPEVNFLWVGGQPEDVRHWQDRLDAEGAENITLTGFVDNAILPRYQAAADVLLMPYATQIAGSGGGNSAQIASPMKMFEYMAAGRAIITSDLPVIYEVLNESKAVFCPPEDLAAWQNALKMLMANPAKRKALGAAARVAGQAYTWTARAEHALAGMELGAN